MAFPPACGSGSTIGARRTSTASSTASWWRC
jgi:hypothetical protein